MPNDAKILADLLVEHRPTYESEGFPPWLRARVVEHVHTRVAEGTTFSALQAELGVSITTLRRWVRRHPAPKPGGFARVVVAQAARSVTQSASTETSHDSQAELYLRSPEGFSLHGISLEQGLRALASLR